MYISRVYEAERQKEIKMRKGQYTREQAIDMVGIATIKELDEINCEPTSRCQCDGDDSVEYSASIAAATIPDGLDCVVTAYYYTTPEQELIMAECDGDGSAIDWTIEGYEIE